MVEHSLLPLDRADGSATYTCNGFSIIGAVNGPIEVQRRDELPEEAALDVLVRPAAGVRGVREKYLESIIQITFRHIILVSAHPRTQIQLSLQVIATPRDSPAPAVPPQAASNIFLLPALLQASILALLSTSIPLSMTMTSTQIAVDFDGKLFESPSPQQIQSAASTHVLAFSSHGKLLVAESEGECDIDTWQAVYTKAMHVCRGQGNDGSDDEEMSLDSEDNSNLENLLKAAVRQKMAVNQRWKELAG